MVIFLEYTREDDINMITPMTIHNLKAVDILIDGDRYNLDRLINSDNNYTINKNINAQYDVG